jgi:hypothetical protein
MSRRGLSLPPSTTLALGQLLPSSGSFGIRLHHAEDIAFGIFAVSQPPDAGDGHFRKRDCAPAGDRFLHVVIQVEGVDGADVGDDGLSINLALSGHQSAINTRCAVGPGFNEPIRHGAFPLGEFPAKQRLIKFNGTFRVFGMDFEVNDSGHILEVGSDVTVEPAPGPLPGTTRTRTIRQVRSKGCGENLVRRASLSSSSRAAYCTSSDANPNIVI